MVIDHVEFGNIHIPTQGDLLQDSKEELAFEIVSRAYDMCVEGGYLLLRVG